MAKPNSRARKKYWKWSEKSYSYLPLQGGQGAGADGRFFPFMVWWYGKRWEFLTLGLILLPCFVWGILYLYDSSATQSDLIDAQLSRYQDFFNQYQPLSLWASMFILFWFCLGSFGLFWFDRNKRMRFFVEIHEVLHFIRFDMFGLIDNVNKHTQDVLCQNRGRV